MKWNELLHNVPRVTPNYNFGASTRISNLDVQYNLNTLTLTFTGEVRSARKNMGYPVEIVFTGIEPTAGLTDVEVMQGYMPKPTLADDDIRVRCSCPSQRFRFDTADRQNRAAAGKPFGAYHRRTNRAPNNPHNLPGMCYHIIEFVDYLQSQGFIH